MRDEQTRRPAANIVARLCYARHRADTGFIRPIRDRADGIWLVSFMHYDLGYFDLEQKTLQPLDNPFGTRLSPMS